ncbi:uncharacterized protein LOC110694129 isoform X1 [Chenopodium quinoa]|uniref:uncharacterized protein LOC110694129 isoform X1 n=1 Tax=Chenopodium quinoa TaxID=63459 RepID=UPI000B76DD07|nr:uncharacterized protein LOC110694129 isoform X1 [Chenopodium quinoa]
MSEGNVEASLLPKLDDIESQNERLLGTGEGIGIDIRKAIVDIKQLKSFEFLKSALKIFTSNTKFMLFMILSILPLFVFMVFYEIKLQKSLSFLSSNPLLMQHYPISVTMYPYNSSLINSTASNSVDNYQGVLYDDEFTSYTTYTDQRREFFLNTFQFSLFYLLLYPFLEFFSLSLTTKIASKVLAAEKLSTFKELFHQKVNFGGPFTTYLCVHLLSSTTLLGLSWIRLLSKVLFSGPRYYDQSISFWYVLFVALQSVMFLALLYKYLDWSAFWNMGMAISCKEEQTGVAALGLSEYYGRHCKKTGFQLMLGFFVFGNALRLPCLYAGLCNGSVAGVMITSIVIMSVSIGNLVKWIAFLLYFEYCKQQTMEKKVDDHKQGKTVKATGDLS